MPDSRIKDFSATADLPASDDFIPIDGLTGGTRKWPSRRILDIINARATRGGLAFDGTTNCRAHATLTGQNIGTGDFSLVWFGQISTVAAEQWLIATGPALGELMGGAGGAGVHMTAAGHLQAGIQASGGSNFEYRRISNFRATYGGKEVFIAVTRTGSTWKMFINGVDTAHTAGDTGASMLATSVASTFAAVNFRGTNYSTGYTGLTRDWGIANCVLTQAQITEMQEDGAVPESLKWGNVTDTSSGNTWASALLAYDTFSGASATGFTAVAASGTKVAQKLLGQSIRNGGAQLLVSFTATLTSGAVPQVLLYDDAALTNQATAAGTSISAGANSFLLTVSRTATAPSIVFRTIGASSYAVSGFSVRAVGFVGYWTGARGGVGLQWPDDSSNKLHAILTTTGARWTEPTTLGFIRALSDGTTSAQQLGGGTILPANIQILRVRARAISGTPSITLGTSSGGSQIVASVALTTAWKVLTIALTDGINTANNSLWMTASTGNVVEVQLAYEQLPA